MKKLSIRDLLKRASELDNDKLRRLLEDLSSDTLIKMVNMALIEEMDEKNPELFNKISTESEKRFK